ncbi:MAG TPA: PLDc N-terminal domain-containing protein [Cyclobacteriaceae bacterium]|nr:PLDc N-terminal domain-containing protein [Cyclobacteriaceae bacterium]
MFRLLFPLLYIALIVYVIIDLVNSNRSNEQKLIWVLVIVLFPLGGAVIYFLVSRGVIKL